MKRAPCEMKRGSATVDDRFAYFALDNSQAVFRYEWSTEKWKVLPPSPYQDCGLAIIDGKLTAVGGWGGLRDTNKLFTLQHNEWVEQYPPMNSKRCLPAVVSTSDGNYIFVIGGNDGIIMIAHWTTKVELLHVRSRRWYKLTNLPQSLVRPIATICGNQLHVIGCHGDGYSCSLQALLFISDQPITSKSVSNILTWTPLPKQPVEWSTVANLSGQLVIIGGQRGQLDVNAIHQLLNGQWVKIGSMFRSINTQLCFVVNPSPDKLMIVGGWEEDRVEECVVV